MLIMVNMVILSHVRKKNYKIPEWLNPDEVNLDEIKPKRVYTKAQQKASKVYHEKKNIKKNIIKNIKNQKALKQVKTNLCIQAF